MKFKSIGRAVLATGMSLAIGFGATACSRDYTVAYVYVTSQAVDTVSAFAVDYQSGALTQINGSPFTGTGSTPVALVPAPNGKFLYTVNNKDSNVTEYAIGTDGKLYGQNTYTTVGTFPTAAAIDSTGSYLYVAFTYQPGFSTGSPGPGGVTVFPINADNTLGTPIKMPSGLSYVPAGNAPVSIAVANPVCSATPLNGTDNPACTGNNGAGYENIYVYVLDQESLTSTPQILGFNQDVKTNALTPLFGTKCANASTVLCTGQAVGVAPTAIAIEPTSSYIYATDAQTNRILGFQIGGGATTAGQLTALTSNPFTPGQGTFPVNLTIEPRGKFLYTANEASSSVSAFNINISNGSLTLSGASAAVGTGPKCVTVEPALGIYLYTSNLADNSVSGQQLNPNTGTLSSIPNTPFPTSQQPSCVTSVANGSHARSIVVD